MILITAIGIPADRCRYLRRFRGVAWGETSSSSGDQGGAAVKLDDVVESSIPQRNSISLMDRRRLGGGCAPRSQTRLMEIWTSQATPRRTEAKGPP